MDTASTLLRHVLSTIQSPVFFQVVVLYQDGDFRGARPSWRSHWGLSRAEIAEASRHHRRFEVFREARKVWDFRLVLCANVQEHIREHSMEILKRVVAVEKAKTGFDDFPSEPLVTYYPYSERT